uniref:Uncharacterized protein n=1 Tax=Globisporangium ultimum (strain ATCC 200006 / CBS 805.95 / DAOM BR144) TaxID=431595 RepID=K3WWM6_GLOUD
MEFLAAVAVLSRAIWSLDEKTRVLMELFHDPALSARYSRSNNQSGLTVGMLGYEKCFKETNLAQLFLCVMRGIAKATIGVGRVWEAHGLSIAALARTLAADCMKDTIHARQFEQSEPQQLKSMASTIAAKLSMDHPPSGGITEPEFRRFVAQRPTIQRFLALFGAEELQNPFTFSPLCSPSAGMALPQAYRRVVSRQQNLYESLLRNYASSEGRGTKRQQSAAILIQSTWRRRCSRSVLERHKATHIQQRHASAVTLQNFLRQCQFAKLLEQHADAEREALNGGLFVAGSGVCIPRKELSQKQNHRHSMATQSPLTLVNAFKFLNMRICSIAASETCALALADDRRTLFAWGRSLPCLYHREGQNESEDAAGVSLYQPIPTRLAYRFNEPARQLACGLRHALVLSDDGMVYSWGFNEHGQLGHGDAQTLEARTNGEITYSLYYDERDARETEYLPQPTRLLYFQGSAAQQADPIPIQQICCGAYFSMVLSKDGDVFSWGEASEGQLGHGDAHHAFQVAFVDVHMLNSAYTFLSEPEPILALSDDEIVQIACRNNHSVALTHSGRVFEWGNWGKRHGRDMEHAFTPMQMPNVKQLRLRKVSVGDHHMVGEGSSVWMRVASPAMSDDTDLDPSGDPQTEDNGFGVTKPPFYLACSAYSCSFEAIETMFAGKTRRWTCSIIELDVDDLEGEDQAQDGLDCEGKERAGSVQSLWAKRVQRYALAVEQVGRFDTRIHQLRSLSYRQNYGYSYDKLLNTWLHSHVDDRFVVIPRGKPPGVYVQFLIPHSESIASSSKTELRDVSEHADAPGTVVEFRVYDSNTTTQTITKRGFAVHAFHSDMIEDPSLTKLQRRKKKMTSVVTEENSLFVIEFDETCLPSVYSQQQQQGAEAGDDFEFELTNLVVGEMTERALAAQEAGALAALLVLDLLDVEPFELSFEPDSGVYIPVLMVHKFALSTGDYVLGKRLAFHELLELMLAPPVCDDAPTHRSPRCPSSHPPIWSVRCFLRTDTLGVRVQSALANGAVGVLIIQDRDSTEMDGETKGAPIFHLSLANPTKSQGHFQERSEDRLVAMISYDEGVRLRALSRMSLCPTYMPLLSTDGCNYELLVDVQLELRAGGTTFAWGNAQNGRLGVAAGNTREHFLDGYEALTDTSYRYLDQPTPIATLAGMEMRRLECGSAHTLAVTMQGKAFSWGRGTRGALAQSSSSFESTFGKKKENHKEQSRSLRNMDLWVPKVIHGLRYENIVQVAANDSCSMFVTEVVNPALYRQRRREIAQVKALARKSLRE